MTLNVHRFGDGETRHYLGIHGWGGGWETFQPLAAHLPPDATLWSVDLPGYGASARLSRWHWEDVAEQITQTARSLPTDHLHLIGNCSGAAFGLAAVRLSPQMFASLFLIDPFAFFPWYFRILVARGVGRVFYATAFENPVGRWMTNRSLADHRTEESDLTRSFEALDHDVVYAYLRMLQQIPGVGLFEDLSMPITVLHGEKTFTAVQQSVEVWRNLWPHASAVEIPAAGHLPIQEATVELAYQLFDGAHLGTRP